MTAAERRVAVAKDVLLLLRRRDRPLVPVTGVYIIGLPVARKYDRDTFGLISVDRRPLHEVLESEVFPKHCAVCARGAAFISCVRLFNAVTVEEAESGKGPIGLTIKLFGIRQTKLIEAAFEGFGANDAAYAIYEMYEDPKARLRVIMENIAANGGTFKPKQITAAGADSRKRARA